MHSIEKYLDDDIGLTTGIHIINEHPIEIIPFETLMLKNHM